MNEFNIRAVRDALRHQHNEALDPIEDIIVIALDRLAEEAVTYGANSTHDFRVDDAAAGAIKKIAAELDHVTTMVLSKIGNGQ
jgi:hypothetical protein